MQKYFKGRGGVTELIYRKIAMLQAQSGRNAGSRMNFFDTRGNMRKCNFDVESDDAD